MSRKRLFDPGRLEAFSDGVIAIAITLLVLGLEVPSIHEIPEKELPKYLFDSLHAVFGYVISFIMIGIYWLQHYAIFHYVDRVNRVLVLLNMLFLLAISFIPFPTGLQSAYRFDKLAVVLYGIAQIVCGLSLLALWMYATQNKRLVVPDTSPEIIKSMTRRIAITPIICCVAVILSNLNVPLSKLVYLTVPVFYFSHRTVDHGKHHAADESEG